MQVGASLQPARMWVLLPSTSLSKRRPFLVAATAATLVLAAPPSGAQEKPTLAGTWSASALKETWSTSDWGDACGPKPTSSGGAPGGTVTVSPQGGDLSFSGAGRGFSTAECWERLPGLKRTAHSSGARGWSNKCASPAGDPRRASISNSFTATDDTIVFQETGVFEFAIQDTKCKASVSRSRSYKLVQRAGEAPAEPTPTATASAPPQAPPPEKTAEPAAPSCDSPGAPARIEVRPTKKLLRPGESFSLSAHVSDKAGCRLSLAPDVSMTGEDGGLTIEGLKITAGAEATAGVRKLAVALAGKTVTVEVEIAPADRYDELLKLRGLNASGEDDRAAVAEIAAGVGGVATEAENTASARKRTFLAIVGGVAGLLAIVGFGFWRRGKAKRHEDERESAVPPANVALFEGGAPGALTCPHCGRDYPAGSAFCEEDGTALIASVAAPPRATEAAPPSQRVPPAIPSAPAPSVASPSKRPKKQLEKICPNCGDRFPADSTFCGKDGTQLVPVN